MSNSDFSISSDDEQDYITSNRRRSTTPPILRKKFRADCSFYDIIKPFIVTMIFFYIWNNLNNSSNKNYYCDE